MFELKKLSVSLTIRRKQKQKKTGEQKTYKKEQRTEKQKFSPSKPLIVRDFCKFCYQVKKNTMNSHDGKVV